MDEAFARSLSEWTAFYALMGGVAGTLVGLLFVAVSLRLEIFRQQEGADARDFAVFILGTFLAVIAVSALALSPRQTHTAVAFAVGLMGLAGLLGTGWVNRAWLVLYRKHHAVGGRGLPSPIEHWSFLIPMGAAYGGLVAVAALLWRGHYAALGWLAVVEAGLLTMGTIAAWLLLSHAGHASEEG